MLGERIASQSEVVGAIVSGYNPCSPADLSLKDATAASSFCIADPPAAKALAVTPLSAQPSRGPPKGGVDHR